MTLVLGIAIAACAGAVQGCTGFGFAMVMVPAAMLLFEPVEAVPTVAILGFMQSAYMFGRYRAFANRRIVVPLLAGAVFGVPIGVYALTSIDGGIIKVSVGALMVVLAAALYWDVRRPIRNPLFALPGVGLLSGILGGSTALTGPPVILFLTNQGEARDVFRASLAAYFATLGVLTLTIYFAMGMFTPTVLRHAGFFAPMTVLGAYFGARYADNLPESQFRRIATVCAGVMGAVLVLENYGSV